MPKETFRELAMLPAEERRKLGVEHTFAEIAQQPALWPRVLAGVDGRRRELARFLRDSRIGRDKSATVVLAGAGQLRVRGERADGAPAPAARL